MTTQVHDVSDRSRYEIALDGKTVGIADYRDIGQTRVITHTEVNPDRNNQGLGSTLVEGALDDIRSAGRSVVALCPFVDDYVKSHSEYHDLVDAETDARLRD